MRARLIALTTVMLLSLVAASPASATESVVGSGSNVGDPSTFMITDSRQADGNIIADYVIDGTYTGVFTGTYTASGTIIFHSDGSRNIRESTTGPCTVLGRTGTLTLHVQGTGPDGTHAEGTVVGSGSGGLAGLHFQGTWKQVPGAPITFSVRLHFDP